jgi:SPP1 gp7 family putative phage head morphogenesis protein
MDGMTLTALWALYDQVDNRQYKLLIYTWILLRLLRKNKRILATNRGYNKKELKEHLEEEVKNLLVKQYDQVCKLMTKSLIQAYQEAQELLNKTLGVNDSLTLQEIDNLIKQTWVGDKNFEERLQWNLEQVFKKYIELIEEDAPEWEFKKLQENYFYRLRRLLDTEAHRDINQACLHAYRSKGIGFVEWIAHEDERTCPVCLGYDHQIFPIEDAPFCPDHPFCRCAIIPASEEAYNKWIFQNMD